MDEVVIGSEMQVEDIVKGSEGETEGVVVS